MSREKQIEEMAKMMVDSNNKEVADALSLFFVRLAEALYNAGYRKQSENVIELPCNIGDSCYPLPRCKKPIVERHELSIAFDNCDFGIVDDYGEEDEEGGAE